MTEDELKATVQGYLNDSKTLGDLTADMKDALEYYYGQPYGNEVEGRSQVVTREVMETIETALPEYMRIFGSEDAVEFDPVSEDDEKAAHQETEVIRHIAYKQNPGIIETYNWLKDGLLQRVGYAKAWKEDEEETTEQVMDVQPGMRTAFEMMLPENAEIIKEEADMMQTEEGEMPVMYHVTVATTEKREQARWESVAPEEMRVSNNAFSVDLDDLPFVAQVRQIPASDLVEMGYDRKLVDSLPAYGGDDDQGRDQIEYARATHSGEEDDDQAFVEQALRPIEVSECYLRTDYDDDGIAELRRVLMAGGRVLENEEVDQQPYIAWCPFPMPHQHVGLSMADMAMDIQLQSSTLVRQMFDNLYLTNSPEREVEIGLIPPEYMDLWLKSTPGGIKPTKKLGASREVTIPFTAQASVPMLELLTKQKEARTGQSMDNALDPNVLARSTEGAFLGAMERSSARNEMVARLFAEQGMKKLFQKLHHIMTKFQDKELTMRINGEFIPVSPSKWQRRTDMTVLIGTGNATTMQRASTAKQVMEMQEKIVGAGGMGTLVEEQHIFNAAADFVSAIGKRKADRYFQDPQKIPPEKRQQMEMQKQQQQGQNPLAEAEQIKAQAKLQGDQLREQNRMQIAQMQEQHKAQMSQVEQNHKHQMELIKQQMEFSNAERDRQSKEAIAIMQAEVKALIEGFKVDIGRPGVGKELNS